MSETNGRVRAELAEMGINPGEKGDPLPAGAKRIRDKRGNWTKGKPYPYAGDLRCYQCGRRTDEQGMALEVADNPPMIKAKSAFCNTCAGGSLNTPDMEDQATRLILRARATARPRRKRPRLTDILEDEVRARADRLFKPYFEILDMEPVEEWSPRTKLDFKQGQVSVAEKLLNRIDGLPTQRIRNVDRDDNDVLPQVSGLPTVVQERILSGLFSGNPELVEQVRADIESTAEEVE